jgi:hypothetical protein
LMPGSSPSTTVSLPKALPSWLRASLGMFTSFAA